MLRVSEKKYMSNNDDFDYSKEIEKLTLYKVLQETQDNESHEKMVYKKGLYSDIWSSEGRWIYIWKIPIFKKERNGDDTVIRIFGMPVIKLVRRNEEKKYCIFNIPIKTKQRTDIVTHSDIEDIKRQLQRLKDMEEKHIGSSI